MTTSTADAPTTPADGTEPPPRRRQRRWVTAILVVVCLLIAAMWVYAFIFAPRQSAARLDDRGWSERAETICAEANERRLDLADERRIDESGPNALAERADIVDKATSILESMLDEVMTVAPTGPDDTALVGEWEGFYRDLLKDRRVYTGTLREGRNVPFAETALDGAPVTEWINDFVIANEMTSCAAPLDLST